ncbi:MAG: SusC/RagA family TonB-linked outer membrane protein, partial [Bacteroidales bacterium]|nr:SusC/RagA family TonB-linked outer membrane protein [Bacteroidales bacterium]
MKKTVVNIIFLFILLSGGKTLHGQDSSVLTGTIRGILAEAVQNVSVSVEGVVGIPVITDSAGQFSILIPDKNSVLIITPPEEYKSQRLFIGSRTNVEIRLTPVDLRSNQDEAIYFFDFEKERNSISSSSVLDTRSLYESSNISIDEYYNGNISGIWAPGQSGMPGTGSVSFINGIHSLNANTQPLYIVDGQALESTGIMESFVDGFTYNPLVGINPSDITNLTIIKDYAATSIYGMRGSNGVVLIETLKPTEVQTVIDFSFRTGISTSPGQLPQLNSDQYRSFAKEVLMSSGTSEEDYPSLYPGLYVTENDDNSFVYNNNTNWQNTIFRNSRMEDIYFRILGGDEIAKYGLSIGYRNNEGIIDQTSFNRISVRFVGDFNMFQWLKFSVSSNLSSNTSNLKESTIISQTSPIYTGLAKNPLMVPYSFDEDGNQLTVVEDVDEMGVSNPMSVIDGFEAVNRNYRFLTNFKMVGDISRNFKINSAVGINFNSMMENLFMPNLGMELYARDEAYNISKSLSNYLFSISNDNFINYKAEIGKSHAINTNLGLRFNINKYQLDWGIAKNSFENDEYTSLQSGTSNLREMGGDNGNWNRMALYGNLNYTFRDKYSLSLSAAGENSTRIGPNAENVVFVSDIPFGLFYSSGLSWRISNEAFLYQVSWIDDLKLRLSYGKTGNDDIGNYDAFNYFYILHYRNTTGMVPGPKTDESLSFEESYQGNVGLDFATWGNRLRLSVDLFKNRTENLLVNKLQESYLGHTYVPVNSGEIENKGWGIDLSGRIIQNKDFSWDAGINISRFTNNVISIDNNL